jgi:four helix bundle protein
LEVYRAAREFRKEMYAVGRTLPADEKFGLTVQIQRAAISLTNNIAEGHGRYHYLDQIRFMLIARGSLEELIDDLNVYADEKYLPATESEKLKQQGWHVSQLLGGYIRFLRKNKAGENLGLREPSAEYSTTATEFSDSTMQQFND